ncbi:MAG: VanZ family protein [Planctomycetia bacterium]|nr:VanZ family protein [Planctomycetia bacterium]
MTRGFALCTVAYAIVLVSATHYPRPEELLGPNAPSDKTLHFLAYATLATLVGATLLVSGRWTAWTAGWLGIAMAVFGVVDELTQPLFGRAAEPLDWVYDCVGISGGLLAVAAVAFTIARRHR